ncbi:MAG: hypothetical protein AB7K71_22530 [Polyangiaceae bacterium]
MFNRLLVLACMVGLGACGSPPEPVTPDPEPVVDEPAPAPAPTPEAEPEDSEASAEPEKPGAPEPEFKPGMSVNDAVNAVPTGTERMNVDPATLSKPLSEFALYEPCKPSAKQKWTVRVAIWQGKAVGVDIEAKPKNDKFVACVDERIRALEWKDKVPSLNTVEYSF